jgi:hypothetical protein
MRRVVNVEQPINVNGGSPLRAEKLVSNYPRLVKAQRNDRERTRIPPIVGERSDAIGLNGQPNSRPKE